MHKYKILHQCFVCWRVIHTQLTNLQALPYFPMFDHRADRGGGGHFHVIKNIPIKCRLPVKSSKRNQRFFMFICRSIMHLNVIS